MTIARSKKKVKKKTQKKRKVLRKKPSVNTRAGAKKKKRPVLRKSPGEQKVQRPRVKKRIPAKRKRAGKKKAARAKSSEVRRLERELERTRELLRQADYRSRKLKKRRVKKRPGVGRPSKISRAEAAKLGWETRRANILRAQVVAETDGGSTVPLSATPNIDPDSTLGQFLRLPHVRRQIEYRTVERGLYAHAPEWYLLPDPIIMVQLILAEQLGTFEERARELAAEFDWSLKEVYDLWHGY